MKFDENLAALHGYLCSDGYVIKNPLHQKHKYYHIALRNTNQVLLEDFQKRFKEYFGVQPHITKEGRCRIQSRKIYEFLTQNYSYYCHEWVLPKLSKRKLKFWLRSFFDAEGWVECQEAKNRTIRIECAHLEGLKTIKTELQRFSIRSSSIKKKKDRNCWRLNLCGLTNLKKFRAEIGFLHPEKAKKLENAINSYKNYNWEIPDSKEELLHFLNEKGKLRFSRNELRFNSIKKENLLKLKVKLKTYSFDLQLSGPWINGGGSRYYSLHFKVKELEKLK